mgnify:CR=1 FL=1
MEQRRLRLGDTLDDYCPRERRVTNHAIVAMIEEDIKQTRCTTCDAEHAYKGARVPRRRSLLHGRLPRRPPPSRAPRRPTSSGLPDSNVRQQATSTPPAGAAARKTADAVCGYVRRSVPMPKMKTHSGAKKRFKLTGSGKLRRQQANRRHYLEHKSSRLTRRLAGDKIVFKGDAKVIRKMLGI